MKLYTAEEKESIGYANVVALDTVLHRNLLLDQEEETISMLKISLLVSKIFIPDNQFVDNPAIVKLYNDTGFQQLLSTDYDGHPAIVIGLRNPDQGPNESLTEMINNHMNFSLLTKFPQIQQHINEGKITTTKQFFDAYDTASGNKSKTSLSFDYISNQIHNDFPIWKVEYIDGQYYNLVKPIVDKLTCMKESDVSSNIQKISAKFKKRLERYEPKSFSRSKAENDLWKIANNTEDDPKEVPVHNVDSVFYDFEKIAIDSPYNSSQSFMNSKAIIWSSNLFFPCYSRTFTKLFSNENTGTYDNLKIFDLNRNVLKEISEILKELTFGFIFELRTGSYKDKFQKNIEKINQNSVNHNDAIRDHLNWIFDSLIDHPTYGKNLRNKGFKRNIWNSLKSLRIKSKQISNLSIIAGAILLGLRFNISPEMPEVEQFQDVNSLLGLSLSGFGAFTKIGSVEDYLKYPLDARMTKAKISNDLIKELTTS